VPAPRVASNQPPRGALFFDLCFRGMLANEGGGGPATSNRTGTKRDA